MSAATPIPKLVALLAMVTAVALVSHEVSAVTANSSEINELMPARIATPSPVTATDANHMKQSLRTGKSSAAKASEERMGFFEAAGRAFSRTVKHAIPSNVLEEDVEALTHILDIIRLEEGVQASEADRKAVINLLQSQNLRGIKNLPDEDFSELVRLLSKTDWASNVNSHDSFRTTKISTAGTFRFDPKASLDSLASDIPLVRPALEDRKGKKFLVHQMVTEDGKLIPLSIPAEQEPLRSTPFEYLKDHVKELDMKIWLKKGLLPEEAKDLLASRLADEPDTLYEYEREFLELFNDRDVLIRKAFREWYPILHCKINGRLKDLYVSGRATEYYKQEFKIFDRFVDAYKNRISAGAS